MSTVTLPLALENKSQQLLLESGVTTLSVVAPETGGGTATSLQLGASLTIKAKATSQLAALLTIVADKTGQLTAHLTIKLPVTNHLPADLTISRKATDALNASLSLVNGIATKRLNPSLTIVDRVTLQRNANLVIRAKGHPSLNASLSILALLAQQDIPAKLTITAKGRPSLTASLTIFHPHANLGAKLTIKSKGIVSRNAHLSISFKGLILIPPDATLPYNETQVYKIIYMHEDGSVTIPTGTFTTSAGTMDPPGVTSSGQATLIPDAKLGTYYVGFVESE